MCHAWCAGACAARANATPGCASAAGLGRLSRVSLWKEALPMHAVLSRPISTTPEPKAPAQRRRRGENVAESGLVVAKGQLWRLAPKAPVAENSSKPNHREVKAAMVAGRHTARRARRNAAPPYCRYCRMPLVLARGSTDIDNEHEGGVDSELCSTHHRRKLEAPV